MLRILSLGGGVQSFTLALLIKNGEIPPIDAAIFADTQWEPHWVYEQIEWLRGVVPFPIHTVSAGNLREDLMNSYTTGNQFVVIPAFQEEHIGQRQCTNQYKIRPIDREKRRLCGLKPGQKTKAPVCETLIGISLDEIIRMSDSRNKWSINAYPLIDLRMTRHDCLAYLLDRGYPIPRKSACIGCPFHSDREWREIKDSRHWEDACEVDSAIRNGSKRGLVKAQYLHRSLKPLDQVDLSTPEERGQLNLFQNECTGMCGL